MTGQVLCAPLLQTEKRFKRDSAEVLDTLCRRYKCVREEEFCSLNSGDAEWHESSMLTTRRLKQVQFLWSHCQ